MGEFYAYELMRASGASRYEAYAAAKMAGLSEREAMRMLLAVFQLSLRDATEVTVMGEGNSMSLDEHEARVAQALKVVFDQDDAVAQPMEAALEEDD